jgi:hypothetical protein
MLMGLTLPYKHPEVKPALLTHLNLGFFALTQTGALSYKYC